MFAVPSDPRLVIVQKLAVVVEDQPDIELDLTCKLCHLTGLYIYRNDIASGRTSISGH